MELVKSRNNDTLALKVINPTDLLPTMYEKIQYNFDQILKYGGGIEGRQGKEGLQGEIGATGIGRKGDKGDRGSKIFFFGSGISDGDVVINVNHLLSDVIIDSNGVYFEVVDVNGTLKYQQQLNIVSIISTQYWLNQFQYQSQSTNSIVKWLLADAGVSNVENNLVLAARTIGISDDIAKFYRVLLGMDVYPGLANSTLLLANILVDDLEDATNLNTTRQLGLKFRANSTSAISANSFWFSYVEQASRYVGILENMATKMYLINDTLSDNHQCHILSKSFYFHNYGSNIDSPTDFVKLTVETDAEIDFSRNAVIKSGNNNSTSTLTSNFGNNILSEFVTINGENRTFTQLPIINNIPILNITTKSSIVELIGNATSAYVISTITSAFSDGHKITIRFNVSVTLSYISINDSGFQLRDSQRYGIFAVGDSITLQKRNGFYVEIERHENKNAKLFLRSELPVADFNQLIPFNGFNGLYQQRDIVNGTLLNTAPFSNLTVNGTTVIVTEVAPISQAFLFNPSFGVCYQKQYLINGTAELEVFYRKRYYVSGSLYNNNSYQWTSWTKIAHESTVNNFTNINNFGAATNFAGLMSINGGLKLGVRTLTVTNQLQVELQPTDQYIKINDNTIGNYGARIYLPVNNNNGRMLMLDLGFNISGNSWGFYRIYNTDDSFTILSTLTNADFNGGGNSIQLSNDPSRPDRLLVMLMCTGTTWVVIWSSAYDSVTGARYKGNSNNW